MLGCICACVMSRMGLVSPSRIAHRSPLSAPVPQGPRPAQLQVRRIGSWGKKGGGFDPTSFGKRGPRLDPNSQLFPPCSYPSNAYSYREGGQHCWQKAVLPYQFPRVTGPIRRISIETQCEEPFWNCACGWSLASCAYGPPDQVPSLSKCPWTMEQLAQVGIWHKGESRFIIWSAWGGQIRRARKILPSGPWDFFDRLLPDGRGRQAGLPWGPEPAGRPLRPSMGLIPKWPGGN